MNILNVPRADLISDNPYLFQHTLAFSKEPDGGGWIKVGPGYYNNLDYIVTPGKAVIEFVQADVNSNNEIVINWHQDYVDGLGGKPSLSSVLVNLGAIGCAVIPLYSEWPMTASGTITLQGLPDKSLIATIKATFI